MVYGLFILKVDKRIMKVNSKTTKKMEFGLHGTQVEK